MKSDIYARMLQELAKDHEEFCKIKRKILAKARKKDDALFICKAHDSIVAIQHNMLRHMLKLESCTGESELYDNRDASIIREFLRKTAKQQHNEEHTPPAKDDNKEHYDQ